MFKDCKTLAELNATRIKLASEGVDLITVNNAYNVRRQELLSQRKPYTVVTPIVVEPEPVQKFVGIPIAGRNPRPGTITFTERGFLY